MEDEDSDGEWGQMRRNGKGLEKKAKFVVFTFEDLVMWREGCRARRGCSRG